MNDKRPLPRMYHYELSEHQNKERILKGFRIKIIQYKNLGIRTEIHVKKNPESYYRVEQYFQNSEGNEFSI